MIKTLTIDGKQVTFKNTGATPMMYKAQFGTDFMKDILKMMPLVQYKDAKELPIEALEMIDFDVFANIVWVLAKTHDHNIPDPMTWLDQFEEFPVFELFEEVQDMLLKNFQTSKK